MVFFFATIIGYGQEETVEEKESKNSLAIFVGGISSSEANAFAIELDYQYRFNEAAA